MEILEVALKAPQADKIGFWYHSVSKNIPLAARSRLEALAVFCCGLGVHFLIFSRARSL
jgi:hypothetical protein